MLLKETKVESYAILGETKIKDGVKRLDSLEYSCPERCTERIAEAAEKLEADIIVNVQGDEPLVHPEMFNHLIVPLKENKYLDCVNLMEEITSEEEYLNKKVVKVVCDLNENAIFFSREPIPTAKITSVSFKKYKQLGVIAFRKDFLLKFTHLSPTPLEVIESIDMLRIIENGFPVRMVKSKFPIVGVGYPCRFRKSKNINEN